MAVAIPGWAIVASLLLQGGGLYHQYRASEEERRRREALDAELRRVLAPYLRPDYQAFSRNQLLTMAAPAMSAIRAQTAQAMRDVAESFAARGLTGSSLEASALTNAVARGATSASQLWQQLVTANAGLTEQMRQWATNLLAQQAMNAQQAQAAAQSYLASLAAEISKLIAAYVAAQNLGQTA